MSAHVLNKQRLTLSPGKGCASLSMPAVIQCDAVPYYPGGGINLSMFVTCTGLLLVIRVSRRPPLHSAYSRVTVRRKQLASCIYSVFISVPTHENSPAACGIRSSMFCFAVEPFVMFASASISLIVAVKLVRVQ